MSRHFPALIIVIPLLTSFAIMILGSSSRLFSIRMNQKVCRMLAIFSMTASLLVSIGLLMGVMVTKCITYRLGGWDPPWGIAYQVDYLNAPVLVVIFTVALLNLLGSRESVNREFEDRVAAFYTLYVLFVTGVAGMTVTGDAFNLYVLLEIASLTGYALIGIGKGRAPLAGLHYVIIGTIGASFYLLGVGYLYIITGTLNMVDLARLLPDLYSSQVVLLAFILCMTGLFVKMAFFPLHAWLPNAYSNAPSASAGLIAPLTTKVMIYVMIRMSLTVFTPKFTIDTLDIGGPLVWMATAAIIMASVVALSQTRLKRMLTYIVIAEVGYMVGGFWLGNRMGMTGAILHILNDAMMTLCVFLAVGAILYKIGDDHFDNLKGLFKKMPVSMTGLVVAAMSIIGVPPTCGFFSKWYLISGSIAAGHYEFVAALLFSSLINVILFFRIFEICYYEPFADHHGDHNSEHHGGHEPVKIEEAPFGMVATLLLVSVLLIVLGIYTGDIVENIIQFAIPI